MDKPYPRRLLALEFLLYAVLTTVMLCATWLTWPDAFIDFSRELYLPWRVSCGDVLYRDLAYYFGPVSVYTNAALFALLGHPSIHALFALNFAFWVATLLALRAILRRIASPLAATIAVSSFIVLFSFSRYTGVGNDNFLAPYSHEITRGFLFALLSLLSLDSALRRRSAPLALFGGFFLAFALFAKPEVALATVVSSAVLLALAWTAHSGHCPLIAAALAFGILAAIASIVIPFSFALGSFAQAFFHAFLKLHLDCFNPDLTSLSYFRGVTGTDFPLRNASRMLWGAILAASPFLLARILLPRLASRSIRLAASLLFALVAAAIGWFAFFPLNSALPLAPGAVGILALRDRRSPSPGLPPTDRSGNALSIAFSVFALALVFKIVLNCAIGHYGFVLAVPAFCCAVILAIRPPCPPVRTILAAALLLGFSSAAIHLQASSFRNRDVTHPVHDAAFLSAPVNAGAFNSALDWIRTNSAPGDTLAVLPEGAILNVLAGRRASNPYFMLEQGTYLRGSPPDILDAYSNAPPDILVLVQTAPPRFGIDYAQDLMAFLNARYTPVCSFSPPGSPSAPLPYLLIATRTPSAVSTAPQRQTPR